jgi:hypothetical protein
VDYLIKVKATRTEQVVVLCILWLILLLQVEILTCFYEASVTLMSVAVGSTTGYLFKPFIVHRKT